MQGKVQGLCGNFDGNGENELMTRTRAEVSSVLDFGNSWSEDECPLATEVKNPCIARPHRAPHSQKQCRIITGATFEPCHSKVQ